MYIERSDNLETEILNFKAIHGQGGVGYLKSINYNHVPTISKDIQVVMVSNRPSTDSFAHYYENNEKLDFTYIRVDEFICFITKIKPLLDYIKTIDKKYIMYLDTSDTALISDLLNPQEILDKYKCKILFNAEDGYAHPDHPCKSKDFLYKFAEHNNSDIFQYYGETKNKVVQINVGRLQANVNCHLYQRSLNAGLFLAEREYLIEVLEEIYSYMIDDSIKGYPYGEHEDQTLWQYVQSKCENEEIQIDYLNHYFVFLHHAKFTYPVDHWEHFNYFNKLKK